MKDFKETLFMPDTAFEMKASLVDKEPKYQQMWADKKIYQKALAQNKGNKTFVLHDGPPYANGSLHIGHAMNKILKDIIVRHKTMNGFYSPFVAGWDTHGLPIENKMLEVMKMSKDDLDKLTLRKEAAKYALSQVEIQKEQFRQMSLFTDFSETYVTLEKKYEASQLKLFKKMYFDGLVYKGLKPVFWSPTSQSALAEAEVEYENISSPQILVAFEAVEQDVIRGELHLVIMTTTPWTLPANAGIAVGEDISYDVVLVENKHYVIASELVLSVKELAKWEEALVVKTVKGSNLAGITYKNPLNGKISPVVIGHHVSTEAGSGLVHMAPLFGEDDFIIGKQNALEMIMHVQDNGTLSSEAGEFAGLFYLDANKSIGLKLQEANALLSLKFIKHSYPHDWRTHKPVIFRGTPQWFVSIDKIRSQILAKLAKITSYPEWGTPRLSKMIETRFDWTISRQRTWGVPIIIFYDKDGNEVKEEKIFDHVIKLVEEHGTDIWFAKSTDELLPEEFRNKGFTKEEDIMDVWFDSGASSIAVTPEGLIAPFDVYFEGSDQYRGWFNSSLINSIAFRNEAPYKKLLSHGMVLDGKQQKMSKSKGNTVDPLDVIKKNGTDILRLWVANSEYTSDVSISDAIIAQTSDIYRNIRTKMRFILGNLKDWNESMKVDKLTGFNALVAEKLNNLKFEVKKHFDEYRFSFAIKEISNFITDLSALYLNFTKDKLYADAFDNKNRLEVLTNLYDVAHFLILALAPVVPTTMEEAYENLPKKDKKESVHLEVIDFSKASSETKIASKWESFYLLKDEIYRQIEEAKKTGAVKREQEVHFNVTKKWLEKIMAENKSAFNNELINFDLTNILMIGKLTFDDTLANGINTWESKKCQRCWRHFDIDKLNDDILCQRCEECVKK